MKKINSYKKRRERLNKVVWFVLSPVYSLRKLAHAIHIDFFKKKKLKISLDFFFYFFKHFRSIKGTTRHCYTQNIQVLGCAEYTSSSYCGLREVFFPL